MKNECSYVRDVLPLYLENMVSEETSAFVKEHLANCPECAAELEAMKTGTKVEKIGNDMRNNLEEEVLKSMKAIRKKFRKKALRVATVITAIIIAIGVLLHIFPVYRILAVGPMTMGDYYSGDEIVKALYIGSASDRREAQAVLRLADKAFNDTRHTRAENEEEYGLLSRFSTDTDRYDNVAFVNYSLELWSAHLGDTDGYLWVYYSYEAIDYDGDVVYGSWKIPSLWKVEKDADGVWGVVSIKEHP